ncbi:MAG TPA: cyclase family protein [Gemmatimonadaceae bacterium]|nr:cyclase family protein [Gemmatimonadaceae bacterium]
MRLIDLSHTVEDGMVTYDGLPAPHVCDFLSREDSRSRYAPGTEFQIGRIEMVGNTGTYVDSPFHRFADGADLAALPLESVADLSGVVLRAAVRRERGISAADFGGLDVRDRGVLVHTGWDRHWRTPEYWSGRHPFLTRDAAEWLARSGARFVGIDSYNIDDTADLERPAHTALLGRGIPVGEHFCNLAELPDEGFRLSAVPVKVRGFGTFPVRAFAVTG